MKYALCIFFVVLGGSILLRSPKVTLPALVPNTNSETWNIWVNKSHKSTTNDTMSKPNKAMRIVYSMHLKVISFPRVISDHGYLLSRWPEEQSRIHVDHEPLCYLTVTWRNESGSYFNTLRPRWNEQHFADDIFKRTFLNENVWISIKISLKFVPKSPFNNIPALVQIMAWRRSGDKPLSEPMMVSLPTHICVIRPQWVNSLWRNDAVRLYWTRTSLVQVISYHFLVPNHYLLSCWILVNWTIGIKSA